MRTEEQCDPSERFLLADSYFSDQAIAIWKEECVLRCASRPKGEIYDQFIQWQRKENEIGIFTSYAYADFKLPKKFNLIFDFKNPLRSFEIPYELNLCVFEAWFPTSEINHGHKHLCVFEFEGAVPRILFELQKQEGKFASVENHKTVLGFCYSGDFIEIKKQLTKNQPT